MQIASIRHFSLPQRTDNPKIISFIIRDLLLGFEIRKYGGLVEKIPRGNFAKRSARETFSGSAVVANQKQLISVPESDARNIVHLASCRLPRLRRPKTIVARRISQSADANSVFLWIFGGSSRCCLRTTFQLLRKHFLSIERCATKIYIIGRWVL